MLLPPWLETTMKRQANALERIADVLEEIRYPVMTYRGSVAVGKDQSLERTRDTDR